MTGMMNHREDRPSLPNKFCAEEKNLSGPVDKKPLSFHHMPMNVNMIPDENQYEIAMELLQECELNDRERTVCRTVAGKHLCNEPVTDEETCLTYNRLVYDYAVKPVMDEFDRTFTIKKKPHLRLVAPPPKS